MINWGIIGLGNMAHRFADAIREVENTKILGITSLSNNKLNNFSKTYNVESKNCFKNYEDLINCEEIDSIYIATINNTHAELIVKCANAKKNILCEKPMSLNYIEATKAYNAIKTNKILFIEGYAYRAHPQTKNLCELILNDEIGEIYEIESSFGFDSKRIKPESRLYNKKLGGGAILDVGCYPTSFALLISNILELNNKLPNFKIIDSTGIICKTGVDEKASATLIFNNKLKAKLETSIRMEMNNFSTIYGSKGKIIAQNLWIPETKNILEIHNNKSYYKKFIKSELSMYTFQIKEFNEATKNKSFIENKYLMTEDESLLNIKIIDEWMQSIH